jgi:membrane protease YdiL (CAAX protease family)
MPPAAQSPPGFWKTVRLLLATALRRSRGRRKRAQELLNQRRGKPGATDWSVLGFLGAILFMTFVNGSAAVVLRTSVESAQRLASTHSGAIVVDNWFYDEVLAGDRQDVWLALHPRRRLAPLPDVGYHAEAREIARSQGGSASAIEQQLRDTVRRQGIVGLVAEREASPGLAALAFTGRLPLMLGSFILLWWGVMLVCQGEGLELDVQRRHNPLWEWLFAHPVPAGAIFLAEILSPMAANPIYWSAPLFAGIVYGFVYGPILGFVAAFLVGVPLTVAAACLGKALEIGMTIRFSSRTRGAMIGLMGWLGYSSMMLLFLAMFFIPQVVHAAGKLLSWLAVLPWPFLQLFLGGPWGATLHNQAAGSAFSAPPGFSFLAGMLTCWLFAVAVTAAGVAFTVWGTRKGLSGATADIAPTRRRIQEIRFGRDPLYRKEFLWFIRDRSAIVQTILIPVTVAGFQLFNMRGILSKAQGEWNYLCGAAILFGTYFLWVLGPKSLASEGQALWIALTWPRGLESLLKAKAWLWSLISSGVVALVLLYTAFVFPHQLSKILLVGAGWFFFGRSMAEKSVTLVTVPASSGEQQKIPWGRRGAAQLGMLTFSIGVLTQQWHIALMGIVYSYITAAAMWESFRARLPYLYDPWSEKLPPPPTLLHAMVAISILVEGGAVVAGGLLVLAGRDNLAAAQAIAYGVCAVLVSIGTTVFLSNRYVPAHNVWNWTLTPHYDPNDLSTELPPRLPWWQAWHLNEASLAPHLLMGIALGLALGLVAHGYLFALQHLPATAELLRQSAQAMARIPNLRLWYAVMAIGFAPFAEEYLFRGLLFRALDREWGGARAILASAAFFAVYHPVLSWPPVFLLGIVNCLVFRKTKRLFPCVLLHLVYNSVVLLR